MKRSMLVELLSWAGVPGEPAAGVRMKAGRPRNALFAWAVHQAKQGVGFVVRRRPIVDFESVPGKLRPPDPNILNGLRGFTGEPR
ncbi:MAG: hypothetical protein ABI178_09110 [Rhodanobacter sp.]